MFALCRWPIWPQNPRRFNGSANGCGYLYLQSAHSAEAESALLIDPEWVSPVLWRSEFRNVLAHYVRKDILSLGDALQIMGAAENLMQGGEHEIVSLGVMQLASESGCSAYDCEFVALARDLGVKLVTVDRQVLKAFPEEAVSLDEFVCAGAA